MGAADKMTTQGRDKKKLCARRRRNTCVLYSNLEIKLVGLDIKILAIGPTIKLWVSPYAVGHVGVVSV